MSKRHHVVSRGYQRMFANGEQVRMVFKQSGRSKGIGTRDAFVVKGLSSYRSQSGWNDELENEWSRVEGHAIPAVRRAAEVGNLTSAQDEVKALAAMHMARSYQTKRIYDNFFRAWSADPMAKIDADRLERGFRKVRGRDPVFGELGSIVRSRVISLEESGAWRVERMADMHNRLLEFLSPLHVQPIAVSAPSIAEFILGDNPVIRVMRGGLHVNVALGNAELAFLTLSPRAAIAFTSRPEPSVILGPVEVQKLNWLVWRSAHFGVLCHPDADWRRSIGLSHPGSADRQNQAASGM